MKYLVAGPTIVNDILLADGSEKQQILGGSVYCVAGIKLWCDDCLYVSNVGPDFEQYYGAWMDANRLSREGLSFALPHTWYTRLIYGEAGLHSEVFRYGEKEETLLNEMDVITARQIADSCTADTQGIYVEAVETSRLWDELDAIRSVCSAKIMWEIPTSAALDPERHSNVLKTIEKTDLFSINFPEAKALFGVETRQQAVDRLLALGKPCFFRAGEKGAYMLQDGQTAFLTAVGTAESVDPTGCGNCSTAASLVGYAEGLGPWQTAAMANVAAGFNARQYGPWPLVTPQVRSEARQQRDMLLQHAAKT